MSSIACASRVFCFDFFALPIIPLSPRTVTSTIPERINNTIIVMTNDTRVMPVADVGSLRLDVGTFDVGFVVCFGIVGSKIAPTPTVVIFG